MHKTYYMDGDRFFCLRHYRESYLAKGWHLPRYKSSRPLICDGCLPEHIPLIPFPKLLIEPSVRKWIKKVKSVCDGNGRIEVVQSPNISIFFYGSLLRSDLIELEKFSKTTFTGFRWVITR